MSARVCVNMPCIRESRAAVSQPSVLERCFCRHAEPGRWFRNARSMRLYIDVGVLFVREPSARAR